MYINTYREINPVTFATIMDHMKVLITGSNGLLGQKLTDAYRKRSDVQFIATAKGTDRYPDQSDYLFESLVITSQEEVERVISWHRPDVVINTAAMTNVDACETDHAGCDALNVHAVKYLAEACNHAGAHLIHVSTDFIFDGTHGPLAEEEKPNPVSYYGNSKLLGEKMVMDNAFAWTIIRTVLVYGAVHDMSRSNIVFWAKNNLEKGNRINVVDDQFRTPTLAEDLAQGCMLAADKKASGIYHISGKNFMSVFDIVYRVADFFKLDKSLISIAGSEGISQPARRPPITGFIIDKARRELGYAPRSFEEGLQILHDQINTFTTQIR
jgi:dTDP-4-dehydrorhamnose reductase